MPSGAPLSSSNRRAVTSTRPSSVPTLLLYAPTVVGFGQYRAMLVAQQEL
jgi:hypothetical protein